ncbi:MAG: hypothetical protein Q8L65_08605, partial [Burkholderiales bacterium]|nr:hypothetical protein [Burkholderiales bacterium]
EFREVISAEYMVFGRKGLGGPQINETKRTLANTTELLKSDHDWQEKSLDVAFKSQTNLQTCFRNTLTN